MVLFAQRYSYDRALDEALNNVLITRSPYNKIDSFKEPLVIILLLKVAVHIIVIRF